MSKHAVIKRGALLNVKFLCIPKYRITENQIDFQIDQISTVIQFLDISLIGMDLQIIEFFLLVSL